MRPRSLLWPGLATGLLALLLASCASDDRPRRRAMPPPPKPVAGEATYFAGQLVASVHVGMEFRRPEGGDEGGTQNVRKGGGHRGSGSVSLGGGIGPMRGGMGEGGGGRAGRGDGPPSDSEGRGAGGPRMMPANGVPLMIHLKLRNTGRAPIEVAVSTFASPLGNFAVQPATLLVPPDESAEFTPMTSFVQGDLPDEMPVTLTLRIAGQTEKQTLVLRPAPRETPPPTEK